MPFDDRPLDDPQAPPEPAAPAAPPAVDLNRLAELVYRLLREDIRLEQARSGRGGRGRR